MTTAEKRSEVIRTRVTPTEKAELERDSGGNISGYIRERLGFDSTSPRGGGSSSGSTTGPRKRNAPSSRGSAGSIPAPPGETTSQAAAAPAAPSSRQGDPAAPTPAGGDAGPAEPSDAEKAYVKRRVADPAFAREIPSESARRALARAEFRKEHGLS